MPFLTWCESQEIKHVTQVTPDDLRFYFNMLRENHSEGGVHSFYRVIHAFFSWWEAEYEPDDWRNPFRKAKMPKPKIEPLDPVSNQTVEILVSTCVSHNFFDIRDKAILLVLFDTGVRANELIMLDRSDLGDHTLHVRFGKGRQKRYVHFGQMVKRVIAEYLRLYPSDEPSLFFNDYGDRFSYHGLRNIVERRSAIAGIESPTLHSFRRAFAINALLSGWDIYRLRDAMGHNDLKTLERYLKTVESMREDLGRMTSPADKLVLARKKKRHSRS